MLRCPLGPMGRTGVAKKAEKYEVFGHPKAAKVDTRVMFELGVYFGARGVAKRRDLGKVRELKIVF